MSADPNYLDQNKVPMTIDEFVTNRRELRIYNPEETNFFTLWYKPGNYTLDMYKSAERLLVTNKLSMGDAVAHLKSLVDEWDLLEWTDKDPDEIDPHDPEATAQERREKYQKLTVVPITDAGLGRQGLEGLAMITLRLMQDIKGKREEAQLGKGEISAIELEAFEGQPSNVTSMDASSKPRSRKPTTTTTPATTRTGAAPRSRKAPAKPAQRTGSR